MTHHHQHEGDKQTHWGTLKASHSPYPSLIFPPPSSYVLCFAFFTAHTFVSPPDSWPSYLLLTFSSSCLIASISCFASWSKHEIPHLFRSWFFRRPKRGEASHLYDLTFIIAGLSCEMWSELKEIVISARASTWQQVMLLKPADLKLAPRSSAARHYFEPCSQFSPGLFWIFMTDSVSSRRR